MLHHADRIAARGARIRRGGSGALGGRVCSASAAPGGALRLPGPRGCASDAGGGRRAGPALPHRRARTPLRTRDELPDQDTGCGRPVRRVQAARLDRWRGAATATTTPSGATGHPSWPIPTASCCASSSIWTADRHKDTPGRHRARPLNPGKGPPPWGRASSTPGNSAPRSCLCQARAVSAGPVVASGRRLRPWCFSPAHARSSVACAGSMASPTGVPGGSGSRPRRCGSSAVSRSPCPASSV